MVRFFAGIGGGGALPFVAFAGVAAGSAAGVVEMALIASSHGLRHIRAHGLLCVLLCGEVKIAFYLAFWSTKRCLRRACMMQNKGQWRLALTYAQQTSERGLSLSSTPWLKIEFEDKNFERCVESSGICEWMGGSTFRVPKSLEKFLGQVPDELTRVATDLIKYCWSCTQFGNLQVNTE